MFRLGTPVPHTEALAVLNDVDGARPARGGCLLTGRTQRCSGATALLLLHIFGSGYTAFKIELGRRFVNVCGNKTSAPGLKLSQLDIVEATLR